MTRMSEPTYKARDYSTRERRIGHVAYYTGSFIDPWRRWKEDDFPDEDIAEGLKLGDEMRAEQDVNRAVYGNAAYGSWPAGVEMPIRRRVLRMMEGKDA